MMQLKISPQKLNQLLQKQSQFSRILRAFVPNAILSLAISYARVMQHVVQSQRYGASAMNYHIMGLPIEVVFQLGIGISLNSVGDFLLSQLSQREVSRESMGVYVRYYRIWSACIAGLLLCLAAPAAVACYYSLEPRYFRFLLACLMYNTVLVYAASEGVVIDVQRRMAFRFGRAIIDSMLWLFFDEYVFIISDSLYAAVTKFAVSAAFNLAWKWHSRCGVTFLGVKAPGQVESAANGRVDFSWRRFRAFALLMLVYQVPQYVVTASNSFQVLMSAVTYRKFEKPCAESLIILAYYVQGMNQRVLLCNTARLAGEEVIADVGARRFKEAVSASLQYIFLGSCLILFYGLTFLVYENQVVAFSDALTPRQYRQAVMHSTFCALLDQMGYFVVPMALAIKQPLLLWISAAARLAVLLAISISHYVAIGARHNFLVNTASFSTYLFVIDSAVFTAICTVLLKLRTKYGFESSLDSALTRSVKSLK